MDIKYYLVGINVELSEPYYGRLESLIIYQLFLRLE